MILWLAGVSKVILLYHIVLSVVIRVGTFIRELE